MKCLESETCQRSVRFTICRPNTCCFQVDVPSISANWASRGPLNHRCNLGQPVLRLLLQHTRAACRVAKRPCWAHHTVVSVENAVQGRLQHPVGLLRKLHRKLSQLTGHNSAHCHILLLSEHTVANLVDPPLGMLLLVSHTANYTASGGAMLRTAWMPPALPSQQFVHACTSSLQG